MSEHNDQIERHANLDPISGTPGAHPVGTGVGALLAGAATGAVTGTVAGPVGTLVGAAIGAVVGGLAGKGVAEVIQPTSDETFWSEHYSTRPYVQRGASFDDYGPAYRSGVDAHSRYPGRPFDDIEPELSREWDSTRGPSSLDWQAAKHASRDAWDRARDGDGPLQPDVTTRNDR